MLPRSQTFCLLNVVLCNMREVGLESLAIPSENCVSLSQESFAKDYPTRQLVAAVERDVKEDYIWQLRAQCRGDQLSQSFSRRKGTGIQSCSFVQMWYNNSNKASDSLNNQ